MRVKTIDWANTLDRTPETVSVPCLGCEGSRCKARVVVEKPGVDRRVKVVARSAGVCGHRGPQARLYARAS